jgi:aminoglycoside phosphotransferase (APT) family kinase protein
MSAQIAPDDIVRRRADVDGGRAPLLILEPLIEFLDAHGLGEGEPEIAPLGDGHSNPTYAVTRGEESFVLRRPPRPPYPKSAHNVLREARLLRALEATSARVPRVLAVSDDEAVIGAPFYVSEMVEGTVFTLKTPQALDTPEQHIRIADELVDALVEIHAVDWRAAGLEDFGRPDGYTERQVRRFAGLLDEYRSRDIPALDRMTTWLQRNIPASSPATIVHGDYRLGNVMYAHEAPARLVAVFDWEMATLGDPLADLGYMITMWAEDGDPHGLLKLSAATTAHGYPSREALIERYAERSGRSTRDIRFYAILAVWKFCVIMEGNYRRALSGASDDAFAKRFGEDVPVLAAHAERVALGGA